MKRLLIGTITLLTLGTLLWLIALSHAELMTGSLAVASELGSYSTIPAIYFLTFICLLVLRYLILIGASFLEHLDWLGRGSQRDQLAAHAPERLPLVSIVIPAYNEAVLIDTVLRSLLSLDYPHYELIVVDDGSSDDTYLKALKVAKEQHRVPIRVITKPNGGKANALMAGLAQARGEFVLNVDADARLTGPSLRACVGYFDDPRVGAVAGNVKVVNRENVLTRIQALEYIEGLAMARKAQSMARTVNIIPGPFGMFRKSAIMSAGGYDDDTFAEDCDLTLKLLMQGWHVVYEPDGQAWVETPSTLLNLLKQRYRWTRGILQAIRKHEGTLWKPRKRPANCLILWYMLFESILWPLSSVAGTLYFASLGLLGDSGAGALILFWWLQLTLLDLLAAAYCVVVEKEDPRLIPYALLFRTFFIVVVDVAKVFAIVEELFGLKMEWGKLQREGKL